MGRMLSQVRGLVLSSLVLAVGCADVSDQEIEALELEESKAALTPAPAPPPPYEYRLFAKAAGIASLDAQEAGSTNCGTALTPVYVGQYGSVKGPVRDFVARVVGIPVHKLDDGTLQECNTPNSGACADIFQNDVYHQDGRMGDKLHPWAQEIDGNTTGVRLTIFKPTLSDGTVGRPVVVSAGVRNGWVMGVAYFDGRTECE